FGVSYALLYQSSRLKISCLKIQDYEEVIFTGIAERFCKMFYFYQC
ncbi:MAG: hypothetical protein QG565_245, partial [Campylobacterota bacterium]|nr:hypothetical protein [Campylobacterota bacterium]